MSSTQLGGAWLAEARRPTLAALGALMLATFCIVTTENLPAGLLPQMADGLGVSLSATGQLVTGYALIVAIFAIPLTYATNRVPRRPLLLALMALFVLASLWSAIASDYLSLLASRAVMAFVHAVFMAVVTVAAAGLFSPSVRGRVIAIVYSASSVANIVGVPAGAWLGQQAGWRAAFVALTVLGMLALVAIVIWLPATTARQVQTTERSTPNTRRYVVLLVVIVVSMIGLSMAFTYTVPFLTDVSGFPTQAISLLLLLRAAAGVVVLTAAGSLADRHPRLASIVPLVLLAVSFLGMYLLGTNPVVAAVFVALSGIALFTMITTLTSELLTVAPGNLYIASAAGNAVFNAGTAAGALLGGLVLPGFGVRSVPLVAGLLAVVAVAILVADRVVGTRTRRVPTTSKS